MTKRQLTLEMVQKYLGQEGKQGKGYVKFPCPICSAEGHDKNGDNLTFYESKDGYLLCHRKENGKNSNHGKKIYKEIMKEEKGGNNELL